MSKKTLIVGATNNPSRYAYLAAERLTRAGHEIVPIGIKKGEVLGHEILDIKTAPVLKDIDTITMYIGPQHQPEYYDYLIGLAPKRIIFNPGTENPELAVKASGNGIETENSCTLVMLGSGVY
ncbi:CoA-binding protein [Marivirga sp. S37H4]|uniref:CoA-binding protein n=1 Tax=Marivirga aurantiaca TaxID=2802615 RepID=A0A935C715_9BACT|nr:CoA-binding protein [Marivirga aurantiaca]MBK6264670.1 CoA-binding protein [Marivirga aurantiaca]